jgi:hypothetical protein
MKTSVTQCYTVEIIGELREMRFARKMLTANQS